MFQIKQPVHPLTCLYPDHPTFRADRRNQAARPVKFNQTWQYRRRRSRHTSFALFHIAVQSTSSPRLGIIPSHMTAALSTGADMRTGTMKVEFELEEKVTNHVDQLPVQVYTCFSAVFYHSSSTQTFRIEHLDSS